MKDFKFEIENLLEIKRMLLEHIEVTECGMDIDTLIDMSNDIIFEVNRTIDSLKKR